MAGFAQSSDAWSQAWLDMQKQYMDVWLKLSRQQQPMPWEPGASPFAAAGGNPWTNSFEQWSKLFGQNLPKSAQDVSKRMFDLGKSYLGMSESFWQLLQQGKDASDWAGDWQRTLQENFKQLCEGHPFQAGLGDPWSGFASLWGLPLSNWQRMACAFSPFPGEMEKALREERVPETSEMTRAARHFMAVPAVGYTREWQEQLQDWGRLSVEYMHTVRDFTELLNKVLQRALELFGQRVKDKTLAGEAFEGLRPLYDLWIDCGEEAYAEQVATPEFPHLQAEMVNALMRMKRHEQMVVEEVMTALNMPTRREMDTTHKRIQELQGQIRQLQDALEESNETRSEAAPATPAPGGQSTVGKTAAPKRAAPKKTASTAKHRAQPKTRKG
jgi:class III poly(R)-hydroxyalkanoic acid synthase PhaE subunit